MASTVTGGLHKIEDALKSTNIRDKKLADLERDTLDVQTQRKFTTDHGVPVSNTDNWLKAVDERHTGPSLLEDQIAREKVRIGRSQLGLHFALALTQVILDPSV